jgi:hypothetical protein
MDPAHPGDGNVATVTAKTMSKSAFLTGFLKKNPRANPTAVNEAWAKAGYTGSVSRSLVGKLRTDLGLSGNVSREPGTVKRAPTQVAAKSRGRNQGKSSFLKELLADHPQANADAVNRAWKKAGRKGSISDSLVSKVRSKLGLAGNLPKGPKPGRKTASVGKAPAVRATKRRPVNRDQMLAEIESRIDSLIFDLLEIGGIEAAEDALRVARRVVVRAQKA